MLDNATKDSNERNLARMYGQQVLRARQQQALALRAGDTCSAVVLGQLAMNLHERQRVIMTPQEYHYAPTDCR